MCVCGVGLGEEECSVCGGVGIQYSTIPYKTVHYNTIQHVRTQYVRTLQYIRIVLYSISVRYSTVELS